MFSHRIAGTDNSSQNVERPTTFSITGGVREPGHYSSEHNRGLDSYEYRRGRTPQRVEHTHYSPRSRPVSRADSTSSARSMIDERLEWAHQDRIRSASRDRSAPLSPFHEHSPFYAEFARDSGYSLPHDFGALLSKCTHINPSIGEVCNITFSQPCDLTNTEEAIHNRRKARI